MLTPFRQDTNSLFLPRQLNQLGVNVGFKTVVGDTFDHLVSVTRAAVVRSDIVIFSGGLGPTEDDLTPQCVAAPLTTSSPPCTSASPSAVSPCRPTTPGRPISSKAPLCCPTFAVPRPANI